MLRAASLAAAPLALLIFSSCDRAPLAPDQVPVVSSSEGAVMAHVQPATVPMTPAVAGGCPAAAPFTTTFDLVVQSQIALNMSVDSVTFHFLDGSNVTSQPITFPSGTLVPADGTVRLPFSPQFGCGIGTPRWVIVDVKLVDQRGEIHTVSVRAPTRQ